MLDAFEREAGMLLFTIGVVPAVKKTCAEIAYVFIPLTLLTRLFIDKAVPALTLNALAKEADEARRLLFGPGTDRAVHDARAIVSSVHGFDEIAIDD